MTDANADNKWSEFEASGRVADYLAYKGINTKTFSNVKGEQCLEACDNGRSGGGGECHGGK